MPNIKKKPSVFFGAIYCKSGNPNFTLGHALGAAGSIEAILCLLAMRDSVAPPTINLEEPEEEAKIFNLVPKKPQDKKINCVMSNSFCVL